MEANELSAQELLRLVNEADAKQFIEGDDIKQRQFTVPRAVMQKFGYRDYVLAGPGKPEILERIQSIFTAIYRNQDLAMGGHVNFAK